MRSLAPEKSRPRKARKSNTVLQSDDDGEESPMDSSRNPDPEQIPDCSGSEDEERRQASSRHPGTHRRFPTQHPPSRPAPPLYGTRPPLSASIPNSEIQPRPTKRPRFHHQSPPDFSIENQSYHITNISSEPPPIPHATRPRLLQPDVSRKRKRLDRDENGTEERPTKPMPHWTSGSSLRPLSAECIDDDDLGLR
jgi:hypothetical protein